MTNEMAFMHANGAIHWELWSADVTNSSLQQCLQVYADTLAP